MSDSIWRQWNLALAERLARGGLDVAAQAVKMAEAAGQARARGDRQALWAALSGLCKMRLAEQKVEEAKALAAEALALADQVFGPRSPQSGTVLSDLLFIEALLGRLLDTGPLVERLITVIMDQAGGDLDQAFSYNLSSLATFLTVQGLDDQAERLMRRVIEKGEQKQDAAPDQLLFVYDNLASFYLAKDEVLKAQETRQRALALMSKAGYPQAGQSTPGRAADSGGVTLH